MKTLEELILVVSFSFAIAACQPLMDSGFVQNGEGQITLKSQIEQTKAALSGVWLEHPMGLYAIRTDETSVSLYADNREYDGSGYSVETVFKPVSGVLVWPESGSLRFMGYSPYNENAVGTVTGSTSNWTVDVKIPVDNDKDDQDDLVGSCDMTGVYNKAENSGEPVPMKYDHLMSSVQVELWSETPVIIKDVSFGNVCLGATQHLVADNATAKWNGEWIDRAEPVTYSIGPGVDVPLFETSSTPVPDEDGLIETGRSLDIGIVTNLEENETIAFFMIRDDYGREYFTRNGHFWLDREGYIRVRDENCMALQGYKDSYLCDLRVPQNAVKVIVSPTGTVSVKYADGSDELIGVIPLCRFSARTSGLIPVSGGYYCQTRESGELQILFPGEENIPLLKQGYLNVEDVKDPGLNGLRITGRTLDVGIENVFDNEIGEHFFFQLERNGELVYSRDGHFFLNQDGTVVDRNGCILQPEFAVPQETAQIIISRTGHIAALDFNGEEIAGAEIPLYGFIGDPLKISDGYYIPYEGVISEGDNRIPPSSGPESECVPGMDNCPYLRQGCLNIIDTDPGYKGLKKTGRTLDLGIENNSVNNPSTAFFQVERDGELIYTRNGHFHLNEDGTVVDRNGYILQPEFAVPFETARIWVSPSGHIAALDIYGQEIASAEIPLYMVFSSDSYDELEDGYLEESDAINCPVEGVPGQDNVPFIRQGYLSDEDFEEYEPGYIADLPLMPGLREFNNPVSEYESVYTDMTGIKILYDEYNALKYGKSMLCIPDRKESDGSSEDTTAHTIIVELSLASIEENGIVVGNDSYKATIEIGDEWLEGYSYTYKLDCSNLDKVGIISGQVSPWKPIEKKLTK